MKRKLYFKDGSYVDVELKQGTGSNNMPNEKCICVYDDDGEILAIVWEHSKTTIFKTSLARYELKQLCCISENFHQYYNNLSQ